MTYLGNSSLGGKKDGAVIIATLCKFMRFCSSPFTTLSKNSTNILNVFLCSTGSISTNRLSAFFLLTLFGIAENEKLC